MYKIFRYTRAARTSASIRSRGIRTDELICNCPTLERARELLQGFSDSGRANVFIQYPLAPVTQTFLFNTRLRQSRRVPRSAYPGAVVS